VRWRKHSFIFFRGGFEGKQKNESVFCAVGEKLKNKKCALAKNKTSLRWAVRSRRFRLLFMLFKNVRLKL